MHGALALGAAALALWLASRHPLSPAWALGLWLAALGGAWRWPWAAWWALPAGLPVLSLQPWSGWLAADEADLLVLAVLAAGHARLAGAAPVGAVAQTGAPWLRLLLGGLGLSLLTGLGMAWWTGPPPADGDAAGLYTGLANALRVAKPLAYALAAAPLLRAALARDAAQTQRAVAGGVLTGLVALMLVVLWERAAGPGLLDFASPYRIVGPFWEMHVGGAAIDAWLALAMPFALWAVATARRPLAWLGAALLLQLLAYVCLITYARGVYGAVLGGAVVLAVLLCIRGGPSPARPRWRRPADVVLACVLVAQLAWMAWASSFMAERLRDTDNDFGSRVAHWQRGLSVLRGPGEWLTGIGLGRLPQRYAALGPAGEFPGAAVVQADAGRPGQHVLRLQGPPTRAQLAGRYRLTQQVPLVPGAHYRLAFDLRLARPAALGVAVCERHLLYEGACQLRGVLRQPAGDGGWQRVSLQLQGPLLEPGMVAAPRRVSLELAALRAGDVLDLDNLQLSAGGQALALHNAGFEQGLSRWFPVIDAYFLPWHIDNLYLEWLIERGAPALLLWLLVCGSALWRVSFGAARWQPLAPCLAASLASGCALGLVSSVMDMPRVALLFLLLALLALQLPAAGPRQRAPLKRRPGRARPAAPPAPPLA